MKFDSGTAVVATAGTRVRLSNTTDKVVWLRYHSRAGNAGLTYIGSVTVSATVGREIAIGAKDEIDFRPGSTAFNTLYVDAANNGDKVDWEVLLNP